VTRETDLSRLRSLTGIKWNYYGDDVLPAWVADMDLPPAPVCVDAVRALLDRGDLGYNFAAAARIPEVFAQREATRFGWTPDVESTRLFCDVLQAVELSLWAHTKPGDGVVLLTPVYHPFYSAIETAKCRLVDVPLDAPDWQLDAERVEAAIDATTRVLLLCNPHNPTGHALRTEELHALADIAERHDLLVISDEIWSDLVFAPERHIPFASVSPEAAARTVTITAASKAFNLAGMCCAVGHLGHKGVAAAVKALPRHLLGAVSSPGAEATLAAWTLGDEWLDATRARLQANRDHLAARLARELPQVGFTAPEATYLAWLDLRALGWGDDPAAVLLEKAGVGLSGGVQFGTAGAGFARLNFATTTELLDEIIDRIVRAVGQA
jgi:cystathionine beta-lyase